jgi:8-oxo-dGTP diphosphatase
MTERYKISVAVDIVLVYDKWILLIKRKNEPFKDCWALPGGFVEEDETFKEAAIRELKEETGYEITDKMFGSYHPLINDEVNRDPRGRVISIAYRTYDFYRIGGLASSSPKEFLEQFKAGDDAKEVCLAHIDDIKNELIPLAFDHRRVIYGLT